MKTKQLLMVLALVGVVLAGCQIDEKTAVDDSIKVGIYDSRIIAYAYWSETVDGKPRISHPDYNSAEGAFAYWNTIVDGKPRYIPPKDDELKGKEFGYMLHQQVFSHHEPVQALNHIEGRLPEFNQQAGVDVIISKWDKDKLAKYDPRQLKDITDKLVLLFNPTEKFLKESSGFEKEGPVPLDTNWLTAEE